MSECVRACVCVCVCVGVMSKMGVCVWRKERERGVKRAGREEGEAIRGRGDKRAGRGEEKGVLE